MDGPTIDLGPGVTALVTTRAGGVSQAPYSSLNLALHVGDDAEHVRANRALLVEHLGRPIVYTNQVHGARVLLVDTPPVTEDGAPPDADAMVTRTPGIGLAVLVADCLPVLLADADLGIVGAAHAGRRGLVEGVIPAVVEAMVGLGARPGAIRVHIGPAICGSCYEVGREVHHEVASHVPGAVATTSWGTPAVDLVVGAQAQLAASGVHQVSRSGLCTSEDERFFSYRRDGLTGRFAGVVAISRRDTP